MYLVQCMGLYCFQLCRRLSLKTVVKSERAQPERGARRARRAERDARTPSKAVRPCTHPTPEKGTARVCERNELSSCNFTREPQLSAALNVTQVQGGTTPQGKDNITSRCTRRDGARLQDQVRLPRRAPPRPDGRRLQAASLGYHRHVQGVESLRARILVHL